MGMGSGSGSICSASDCARAAKFWVGPRRDRIARRKDHDELNTCVAVASLARCDCDIINIDPSKIDDVGCHCVHLLEQRERCCPQER